MKEYNRRRYFFNSELRDMMKKMYEYNKHCYVPTEDLLVEEVGELLQAKVKYERSAFDPSILISDSTKNYIEEACDVLGLCYSLLVNYFGLTDEDITGRIAQKYKRAIEKQKNE